MRSLLSTVWPTMTWSSWTVPLQGAVTVVNIFMASGNPRRPSFEVGEAPPGVRQGSTADGEGPPDVFHRS